MQVALNLATPLPLFSSLTLHATNPSNCKLPPTSFPSSSNKLATSTSTTGGLRSYSVKPTAPGISETADYDSTFSYQFPLQTTTPNSGKDFIKYYIFEANVLNNLLFSLKSRVFPAEACETIGGDACLADVYPEVKLKTEATRTSKSNITTSESVDRDYLQYNDPKTYVNHPSSLKDYTRRQHFDHFFSLFFQGAARGGLRCAWWGIL